MPVISPLHGRWAGKVGVARPLQFLALAVAQVRAEVQHLSRDVAGLEVSLATVEVHETARSEAAFFIEHEPNAPTPAHDGLAATAALGLSARRSLGAVDAREAPVRQAAACRALQAPS